MAPLELSKTRARARVILSIQYNTYNTITLCTTKQIVSDTENRDTERKLQGDTCVSPCNLTIPSNHSTKLILLHNFKLCPGKNVIYIDLLDLLDQLSEVFKGTSRMNNLFFLTR